MSEQMFKNSISGIWMTFTDKSWAGHCTGQREACNAGGDIGRRKASKEISNNFFFHYLLTDCVQVGTTHKFNAELFSKTPSSALSSHQAVVNLVP